MVGIVGYGMYIPVYRLKPDAYWDAWMVSFASMDGVKEKAVLGWDEDVVTMGVEAAQNALNCAGMKGDELDAIYLASTSTHYSLKQSAPIIAYTITAREDIQTADFAHSENSTMEALAAACDFVKAGRGKTAMVIASDAQYAPPGNSGAGSEHWAGAGAGAVIIGNGGVIAEIEDIFTVSREFTDRFRVSSTKAFSENDNAYYSMGHGYNKSVITAAKGVIDRTGNDKFDYVVLRQHHVRPPRGAAVAAGLIDKKDKKAQALILDAVTMCGDTGTADIFINLASIFSGKKTSESGKRILAVGYGSGVSTAVSMVTTDMVTTKKTSPDFREYTRKRKVYVKDFMWYAKSRGWVPKNWEGALPKM